MRKYTFSCFTLACLLAALPAFVSANEQGKKNKHIFLVGMKTDHSAGEHEYMAGLKIIAECLKQTPGVDVTVFKSERNSKGWPAEAKGIENANAIVGFLAVGGTYFLGDKERRDTTEKVLKKGAGFVALHWAVESPKKNYGDPFMAILGGYYEPGYSKNPHNTATVKPTDPKHPIARGWKAFDIRDEWYFKIRLLPEAKPVVTAVSLTDRDKSVHKDEAVAWVYERKDSKGPLGPGRSFGFTGAHFHLNFGTPDFRQMIVNGILWTADVEIPEKGAPIALKAPVPKIPKDKDK